jgi:hypothetical protein
MRGKIYSPDFGQKTTIHGKQDEIIDLISFSGNLFPATTCRNSFSGEKQPGATDAERMLRPYPWGGDRETGLKYTVTLNR